MNGQRGRPRNHRRPGRPRAVTIERAQRRLEFEHQQAQNQVPIDDLDHGVARLPAHLLAKGKIVERMVVCGKKGCPCTLGGKAHGPYFYLVINVPAHMRRPDKPRQRWIYLTKEEAERFRKRITNFNVLVKNMFSDLQVELNL
jgi:hypothetical protein